MKALRQDFDKRLVKPGPQAGRPQESSS